jgi:peptide/nickel transport system substrate-binding protein
MSVDGKGRRVDVLASSITRRDFIKGAAVLGAGAVLVGPLAACGGEEPGETASTAAPAAPKMGGNLRVGIAGGSTKETVDAHQIWGYPDQSRCNALYDTLFVFDPDTLRPVPHLAESAEPKDAAGTVWIVKLRPDVTFHNGKTVDAEDVVFSFKRILDPDFGSSAATTLGTVDPKKVRKVDAQTIEIGMLKANAVFPEAIAEVRVKIVPVDYDPKKPVGTGPFKYQTFVPGERSLFVANPDYFTDGPYVDQVEVIDFTDDTSRVNALLSGAVDVIAQVPRAQAKAIGAAPGFKVLHSECGNWDPFDMMVDRKPFKDDRVRQAFRLIPDRGQMVDLALAGYGRPANDMYCPFDPGYPADLPQRDQDPEQAKALLKEAGLEGMSIELITSAMDDGLVEAAQVFKEQATVAGVSVTIRKVDEATYWDQYYMDTPFTNEYWSTRNYLYQANLCTGAKAQWDVTKWHDDEWQKLVDEAWQTTDDAKRNDLVREAMTIEYERGTYIVPYFKDMLDGHSEKVVGLRSEKGGSPLNDFRYQLLSFA